MKPISLTLQSIHQTAVKANTITQVADTLKLNENDLIHYLSRYFKVSLDSKEIFTLLKTITDDYFGKDYRLPLQRALLNQLTFSQVHTACREMRHFTTACEFLGVAPSSLQDRLNKYEFKGSPLYSSELTDLSIDEAKAHFKEYYDKLLIKNKGTRRKKSAGLTEKRKDENEVTSSKKRKINSDKEEIVENVSTDNYSNGELEGLLIDSSVIPEMRSTNELMDFLDSFSSEAAISNKGKTEESQQHKKNPTNWQGLQFFQPSNPAPSKDEDNQFYFDCNG